MYLVNDKKIEPSIHQLQDYKMVWEMARKVT